MYRARCLKCHQSVISQTEIQRGQTLRCPECQSVFIAQFIDTVDADTINRPAFVPPKPEPPAAYQRPGRISRLMPCFVVFLLLTTALAGVLVWWTQS